MQTEVSCHPHSLGSIVGSQSKFTFAVCLSFNPVPFSMSLYLILARPLVRSNHSNYDPIRASCGLTPGGAPLLHHRISSKPDPLRTNMVGIVDWCNHSITFSKLGCSRKTMKFNLVSHPSEKINSDSATPPSVHDGVIYGVAFNTDPIIPDK